MQKMSLNAADEWAIHIRAVKVVFEMEGELGTTPHYNSRINNHERVTEYAESIGAELVVARYFGVDFDINSSRGKREADVTLPNGQGIEVRWTSYTGGNLIVYPNDRDNDVAILVTGKSPEYFIVGWLPVAFAKRKRFKNPRQESWWVDQPNINPIETFMRSKHAYA